VELAHIKAFDDKRNAYIATGAQYIAAANAYLKTASELNSKRLSYLQTADRHIETATSHTMEGRQLQYLAKEYREEAKSIAIQAKVKMASFLKEITQGSVTRRLKIIQMEA
jgi:hypothetical protein